MECVVAAWFQRLPCEAQDSFAVIGVHINNQCASNRESAGTSLALRSIIASNVFSSYAASHFNGNPSPLSTKLMDERCHMKIKVFSLRRRKQWTFTNKNQEILERHS